MSNQLTIGQKAFLGFMLLGSGASLYNAFDTAKADFYLMKPRAVINKWQKGIQPSIQLWGVTRNELQYLWELNPSDPQVAENLGHLYALQAMRSKLVPELQKGFLEQSIVYFRESIKLRPMAPYAWANLAFALHQLDRSGDEFFKAFDRAFRYGQRELSIQKQLAEIGFSRWGEIGEQRQMQLKGMVNTAIAPNKLELLEITKRHHLQTLFSDKPN